MGGRKPYKLSASMQYTYDDIDIIKNKETKDIIGIRSIQTERKKLIKIVGPHGENESTEQRASIIKY